ncbi:MAG: FAD-dependent oxidoreductase [Planctomycetes bacterium]|nr:FAD-dependent oxidoreductase [Planctomycetota bacterium]MBL7041584.1 FAD-dependent oxidoreductase [Pirellulaceae bacterium]
MSDRSDHRCDSASRRRFLMTSGAALLAGTATGNSSCGAGESAAKRAASLVSGNTAHVVVPEKKVEVMAEADVLVCGGGPAGVAAACAASRCGAKTVLIERWPFLGGMGTAALVNIWHLSDREKIVIRGIIEEAVERAERRNWIRFRGSLNRHETHNFDPEGMKIVFHDMLEASGVRTICHLVAGEPIVEGGRIQGVLVDTKRGRRAILAKIVIDATGDGDVAAKAGAAFDYGRESDGLVQGATMMYRICGIDEAKVKSLSSDVARQVMADMREAAKTGKLPPFQPAFGIGHVRNRCIPNMCPVAGNALDEEELTQLTIKGRRQVFAYWDWLRERLPGLENMAIEQTGASLGIRESRRVRGVKTLTGEMVLDAQKQPDTVGHGFWMIDIHDPKGTGYTTWNDRGSHNMLPAGQSYHIPLGMCLNPQIPNLAVAGRCASSTHEAHSSVRLQSHVMVMGQGVGTAAALALAGGQDMDQIDVKKLQTRLRADGAYIEDVPQI